VCKEEGEKKGSARRSVHRGCYYTAAAYVKVDPQCCRFGRRESDFALQGLIECRAAIPEQVRVVALRWQSSGLEVQSIGREVWPQSSGREVRP
jgi:hypothetical protein